MAKSNPCNLSRDDLSIGPGYPPRLKVPRLFDQSGNGWLQNRQRVWERAMVGQRFNVERTAAGQQFVIPGTEKPRAAPRIKYAKEGSQ